MNQPKSTFTARQLLFALLLLPFLAFTAWWGYQVYHVSNERADMKDDYMEANSIMHGIFNVNNWRESFKSIIKTQIEDFELTPRQDSVLEQQVSSLLHKMVEEAESQVEEGGGIIQGKLKRWAVDVFVDWDNLHEGVPGFTATIMEELTSEESKERLKILALDKFNEYADKIYDDTLATRLMDIYTRYDQQNLAAFNQAVAEETQALGRRANTYTYYILSVLAFFLLLWGVTYKWPELRKPLFFMSVLLALIVLITGLSSPMIEIDARIQKIDFVLLDEHIEYEDQMLFYRSKSILQVVGIMMESARFDSKAVGFLILAFSVILPVSKLISTQLYLLGGKIFRRNKIVGWLAFKSGKWSMADVMVVAIFMSYVGFDGIMDNQLKLVERHTEQVTSITTNLTSLRPGFILFVCYVLYGLILAAILQKISPDKQSNSVSETDA